MHCHTNNLQIFHIHCMWFKLSSSFTKEGTKAKGSCDVFKVTLGMCEQSVIKIQAL